MTARIMIAALVMVTILCGCVAKPAAGRTIATTEATLTQLAGVRTADVTVRRTFDGFIEKVHLTVRLQLEVGYTVEKAPDLADYLVRSLWSINSTRPTDLVVAVQSSSGESVDISDGAIARGWKAAVGRQLFLINQLDSEPTKSTLGTWPGGIPGAPEGAIVQVDPAPSAQRSLSANPWMAASRPSVSKEPSSFRVK